MFGRKVYNRCPVENEPLVICELEGIEVDFCTACGGIWLDRGEIDLISARAGAQPVEWALAKAAKAPGASVAERKCPRCARKMLAIESDGLEIEVCPHGDGYWLDGGELQTLIGMNGEPTAEFLEEMFKFRIERW